MLSGGEYCRMCSPASSLWGRPRLGGISRVSLRDTILKRVLICNFTSCKTQNFQMGSYSYIWTTFWLLSKQYPARLLCPCMLRWQNTMQPGAVMPSGSYRALITDTRALACRGIIETYWVVTWVFEHFFQILVCGFKVQSIKLCHLINGSLSTLQ